MALDHCCTG